LRSDRFGRTPAGDFLLPPAVSIQVYSDAANLPSLVVIDPGGLSRPTAAAKAVRIVDESALSGRRLLLQLSAAFTTRLESAAPPAAPAGPPSGTSSFPPLALRI
jgi:hypothetical protein